MEDEIFVEIGHANERILYHKLLRRFSMPVLVISEQQ